MFSLILSLIVGTAHAQEKLILAALDYPPMAITDSTPITGVFPELAREMTKTLGIPTQEIKIASDRVDRLPKEIHGIAFLFRTPAREKLGFKWIGSFVEDHLCFLTIKPHAPIATVEAANKVKMIGVNGGSSTEKKLKEMGVTNAELAPTSAGNIRKLVAGKIDAWFVGGLVGKYFSKTEKTKEGDAECSGDFGKVNYAMAATESVTDVTVNGLKAEFEKLKANGTIDKLLKKYQ